MLISSVYQYTFIVENNWNKLIIFFLNPLTKFIEKSFKTNLIRQKCNIPVNFKHGYKDKNLK